MEWETLHRPNLLCCLVIDREYHYFTVMSKQCKQYCMVSRTAMASNVYAKACPVDSDKDWYHGELTRDQAEETLRASGADCFLIRKSKGRLILSLIHHGEIYHAVIEHGPGWYSLSSKKSFSDLNELVSYHLNHPIITESGEALTLGAACRKADHNSGKAPVCPK